MNIGLDFDGVISDCTKVKAKAMKRLFNIDFPADKIKMEIVVEEGVLTLEQYRCMQKEIYHNPQYGLEMDPVPGALYYVHILREQGNSIKIITPRDGDAQEIARAWMFQRGLYLPVTGVGPGKSKVGACQGLDAYVDDDLKNLEPLVEVVPHRFLFHWEYNKDSYCNSVATRVDWDTFYSSIQRINDSSFS
jgi:hypothetical protein